MRSDGSSVKSASVSRRTGCSPYFPCKSERTLRSSSNPEARRTISSASVALTTARAASPTQSHSSVVNGNASIIAVAASRSWLLHCLPALDPTLAVLVAVVGVVHDLLARHVPQRVHVQPAEVA